MKPAGIPERVAKPSGPLVPDAFRQAAISSVGGRKPLKAAGVRVSPKSASRRVKEDGTAAFFGLPVDESHPVAQGCAATFLEEAGPHAIAATYSFHAPVGGAPYELAVRFIGIRKGVRGPLDRRDRFQRTERVEGLVPDGGRVSLTTRVSNLNAGRWRVLAEPIDPAGAAIRSEIFPCRVTETSTQFGLLAQGPQVRLWVWPAVVGLGALVAFALQWLLADRVGIAAPAVFGLSVVGSLLGFVGGKLWYLGLHRKPLTEFLSAGACIQGFLVVSLGVLAGGSLLLGLPVGTVLDITTPGIFLGVAVGRPGCFLTGCCAGRPSGGAWGLLSSDRRLAIRRFPVQLIEAAAGLVLGLVALGLVLVTEPPFPGVVFVGSLAAYTLIRQLLFPLRVESRTRPGRLVTIGASGLLLLGAVAVSVV
jgi:phosphatidylglycerol:prolipoprotein diacylglycerol transferase